MNSIELAWRMRSHEIEMVHNTHASHIGAALSVTDIIAVLYSDILKYNAKNPQDDARDRVVLSKGHAGIAIYSALAESGFFPVQELEKYYTNGSVYSGHVSHKGVPGVEFSTGSLGHGVAVAAGLALAAKIQNKSHKVYAIAGDGECDEGVIWETALIANQNKLNNLIVIVDHNHMQAMGDCEEVSRLEPFGDKWRSFGWDVIELKDGNNHKQLKDAFMKEMGDSPRCIIANTTKGKGISFMENELLWHYRDPQGEFYEAAVKELEAQRP